MSALQGVTVVEVGGFLAAPWATMQLADLGPRVIKVEPMGLGDATRNAPPFVDGESVAFACARALPTPRRRSTTLTSRPGSSSGTHRTAASAVAAMVLRSSSAKAFIAGIDITQFREFHRASDGVAYEKRIGDVVDAILAVQVPTIAAVSGSCVGGGLLIACACDLHIATVDARFGVPVARTLGNCLSQRSCRRMVELLGRSTTLDLLLRARLLCVRGVVARFRGNGHDLAGARRHDRCRDRPPPRARPSQHAGNEDLAEPSPHRARSEQ